ncbi:MAG: 16S rRNA (uracil(1498)-N(3))-methyltransferase, partial [Gammaproteobacteria bacterium]|nr:16S rRNA (uracil(1498)-N(3))-methyltransferase [Gammaproteobacteria bacterium]
MSQPRFYTSLPLQINQETRLPEVAAHHASRVLRMQPGDLLTLFNGDGCEYAGEIVAINKKNMSAIITAKHDINRESLLDVVLIQGISSGERMDYTIQKAVELGVNRIIPVISERSVVRFAGDRSEKRLRHWRQIVISACEQCGRNRLPEIVVPQTFQKWLEESDITGISWIFVPEESGRLRDQPRPLGLVT